MKALDALRRQQVNPAQCGAMLVSVTGSTNMTMGDFDDASRTIHEAIDEEVNIVIGLLIDDALVGNVRVLVMAKGQPAAL